MNKHTAWLLAAFLTFSVCSNCFAVDVGQTAPVCDLGALGKFPGVNTRQYSGKVLYVDFWASWCIPCLKSFPFLNSLDQEFKGRGLQIIGVNVDEKTVDAATFLAKSPARFVVGSDTKGKCPEAYGVMGMPSSYLVDSKGLVRMIHQGFREGDQQDVRRSIEALLDEVNPIALGTDDVHSEHQK